MEQKKVDYKNISIFQGLNELRFFAAFLVLMHHSETIKKKNGIHDLEWLGLFRNGGNAVNFFFVLSGFLITYLLLKEINKTTDVSIKKFYIKRILRIWPLYFLLVITGTIGLPFLLQLLNVDYQIPYSLSETWYYFVFFVPGLVTYFYGHHLLEPLWSIGVEETFYLFWAPLVKYLKNNILTLLISVIILKFLLYQINFYFIQNELLKYILSTFNFEAMAIGGLGAYFVFKNGASLNNKFIFNTFMQILIIGILIIYLLFHTNIDNYLWNIIFKNRFFSSLLLDALFLYLILCTSVINKSIVKIRNKLISYLGEISYGIYMYHMLVIFAVILFLKKYLVQMNEVTSFILFYSTVSGLTIFTAALSKRYFEDYFLKLKSKWTQ